MEERVVGGKEKKYVLYTVVGEERGRAGMGVWVVRILLTSLLLVALAVVPYVSLRLAQVNDRTLVVFQPVPAHNHSLAHHHKDHQPLVHTNSHHKASDSVYHTGILKAAAQTRENYTTTMPDTGITVSVAVPTNITTSNQTIIIMNNNNSSMVTLHESVVTLAIIEDANSTKSSQDHNTSDKDETEEDQGDEEEEENNDDDDDDDDTQDSDENDDEISRTNLDEDNSDKNSSKNDNKDMVESTDNVTHLDGSLTTLPSGPNAGNTSVITSGSSSTINPQSTEVILTVSTVTTADAVVHLLNSSVPAMPLNVNLSTVSQAEVVSTPASEITESTTNEASSPKTTEEVTQTRINGKDGVLLTRKLIVSPTPINITTVKSTTTAIPTHKPLAHKLVYIATTASGNHVGGFSVWKTDKTVTDWSYFFENVPIEYQSHQDATDHEMRGLLAAVRTWMHLWQDYHVVLRSHHNSIEGSEHQTYRQLINELEDNSDGHYTYEIEWRTRKADRLVQISYCLSRLHRDYTHWFRTFEGHVDDLLGKQDWKVASIKNRAEISEKAFSTNPEGDEGIENLINHLNPILRR